MFKDRLKILRKEKHITQEALAKMVGVERSTVAKWESQSVTPPVDMLRILADLFEVSIDYLVGVDNNKECYEVDVDFYKVIQDAKSYGFTAQDISTALSMLKIARSNK